MASLTGDNYNIQETWNNVCRSFAQTTNIDLTTSPAYSIDQVLDQIRSKQDDDEQRNSKYKVAKDVIGKTLTCIEVLGGIAAQGASMVFGPSALCFNAVSYLIQAGANYKRIFSSLAELFNRISDVLERCKIYLRMPAEAVDISLRRIINEELLCFVDICALSMKVLKGHKIFIALKVLAFNGDEGVGGQLVKLAELVEREAQMRATLGFESQKSSERNLAETREGTKKIDASVGKLLEMQWKNERESTEMKQLEEVDSCLDGPSKTFAAMEGRYRHLLGRMFDGSGQWLLDDPVYREWASCEGSPLDVLCISGGEGYGKSYLFATVIRNLQKRYSQVTDSLSRTSIGYYFFEQENPARGATKDAASLVKGLKTVAYQLASYDLVYRKELASSAKSIEAVNAISQLWDLLFAQCYRADSTFFILLDGAEHIARENFKQLLSLITELQKTSVESWGRFRLRILFSAREETVEQITSHLPASTGLSIIPVASRNESDIKAFINDRLGSMEILSSGSTQAAALKKDILERLAQEAHGDFVNTSLLLNEIAGKERPSEIRDVLSRAGEKRSDTIARKIQKLNDTLSEENISDLNELLVWVMHARCALTLRDLEAVLYVKNGEPSLRSLADEIKDRYSALFQIEGRVDPETNRFRPTATVSLVSASIEEYFREKSASEEQAEGWNPATGGDVTESEVKIVRRFLDLVCDPQLFKKFEFDAFFDKKVSKKTARIGVDDNTAQVRIVMTCLKAVTAEQTDEFAPVIEYGTLWLEEHLWLIDRSLVPPRTRAIIGPLLVKIYTDPETIKIWWTERRTWVRLIWIYKEYNVPVLLDWLQDSAVTRALSGRDLEWVRSLNPRSKPEADLLEHVARFMAHKWLQTGDWELMDVFLWVSGYSNKIASRKDPNVARLIEDPITKKITASQILEVAEWARQHLGLEALGYEETRNVARTLRTCGKLDEAVEEFKLASSLATENWLAQWGLAQTYAGQGKFALALETLEEVKATIEGKEGGYLDISFDLAKWTKQAGNLDKAWEIYESILQEAPDDYETAYNMISLLHQKRNYEKLIEFLEHLKNSKDEETGLDRRTQLFLEYYWKRDYHQAIAAVRHDSHAITTVKESYRAAVDAAETKGIMAALMHHYAKFIYDTQTSLKEKEMALSMWVRIMQLDESKVDARVGYAKVDASRSLAKIYFEEALHAGPDSELGIKYLDDLTQLATLDSGANLTRRGRYQYPLELLARYYTLRGEIDKAKDVIKPFVKINLDLLSDVDPSNDWQGFRGLAIAFMFAGQDAHAIAAWSLITPNHEGEDAGAHQLESTEKKTKALEGPLDYICDGPCGVEWTYADDIYVCRECPAVQFNEDCLRGLRDGSLKLNICCKTHEMFHVPKYDEEELKRIGTGNVKVGQEVMSVEDWVQQIRKGWGFCTE